MAAPNRVLEPPTSIKSQDEFQRWAYDLWARVGGFNSNIEDLEGLEASVTELNYSVGVTSSIQAQLDTKANISSLGSMATQDSDSVSITGGTISVANLNGTTFTAGSATTSTLTTATATVKPGSAANNISVGGTLSSQYNTVGNVGASETALLSYTLPANALNTNGQFIEIRGFGFFAANADSKQIRIYFGSNVVFEVNNNFDNGYWSFSILIIRVTPSTQRVFINGASSNITFGLQVGYFDGSQDLTTPILIKFTGQGVSTNDVDQTSMVIEWKSP